MSQDKIFMAEAIALAARGKSAVLPNPRVGAVVVKNNKIVGRGWHKKIGGSHAEPMALKQAGPLAKDATLYCSLEPCSHQGKQPPCSQAIVATGIKRVVFAQKDPNPAVRGSRELNRAGIEVKSGVMAKEAAALNPGFNKAFKKNLPHIHMKLATSLDGFMALKNGCSQWLTGEKSRQEAHRLRGKHQVIMTAIGTVLADDPQFNVRYGPKANPIRLILDSRLRLPPKSKIINSPGGPVHVVCGEKASASRRRKLESFGVTVHLLKSDGQGRARMKDLMALCLDMGWLEIMLEGGPEISTIFLKKGLVDEISWFQCPKILGQGLGIGDLGVKSLDKTFAFCQIDTSHLGDDILWHGMLQNPSI